MQRYPQSQDSSRHERHPEAQPPMGGQGHRRHTGPRDHRPRGPLVRWGGLATGSLVGIGAWAYLYVLGAALAWAACSLMGGSPGGPLLGLYGAVAASVALGLGAYAAARTGGAQGPEAGIFYGVCMWCMSTVTLVAVAVAAAGGAFAEVAGAARPLLAVGLSAIGLEGAAPQPGAVLGGMVLTLSFSLLLAVAGAVRGAR